MVIIGLLAALVGPRLFPQLGKGKQGAAKAQIELLSQALDQFRLDVGRYPKTQEGLNALVTNLGTHGEYDLWSYGRDGSPGGRRRIRM